MSVTQATKCRIERVKYHLSHPLIFSLPFTWMHLLFTFEQIAQANSFLSARKIATQKAVQLKHLLLFVTCADETCPVCRSLQFVSVIAISKCYLPVVPVDDVNVPLTAAQSHSTGAMFVKDCYEVQFKLRMSVDDDLLIDTNRYTR